MKIAKILLVVHFLTVVFNPMWAQSSILELVTIPSGDIIMGTDEWGDDVQPAHQVRITQSFSMSSTEITNTQAAEVFNWAIDEGLVKISKKMLFNKQGDKQELVILNGTFTIDGVTDSCRLMKSGKNVEVEDGYGDYPLIYITWYGSVAFCNYLSLMEGLTPAYDLQEWTCNFSADGYRLPTEAEWALAVWGGPVLLLRENQPYWHPWGIDFPPKYGNINEQEDHYISVAPVGAFLPNGYGLYDMEGNVSEWCNDWYGPYGSESQVDPTGPASGETRVSRGSNWYTGIFRSGLQERASNAPFVRGNNMGFRPVRP